MAQTDLSRLIDRSLRSSLLLVGLLAMTGIGTAIGLLTVQSNAVAGHDMTEASLFSRRGITSDPADAISNVLREEHAGLAQLQRQERIVMVIGGVFLVLLLGWSIITLLRSRQTARGLLTRLGDAVKAIEQGRAELQAFTDAAPLGVFHIETNGAARWLNAQASSWAGHPASSDLATVMAERVHTDDRPAVIERWQRLVQEGVSFDSRFRFTSGEGTTIWAHARAVPVLIDGQTTGYAAVMQDITEERVLSEEIVRSRRRMRKLADSVPALLARLDATDTYRFVNATYRTWFSDKAPVVGSTLQAFLGPEAHTRLRPILDRVRLGNEVRLEMSHASLNGRAFVGDITYTPDIDDDGVYCGFYVLVTDITERKQLEESLYAAKELAQVTLDAIGDAVITTDNEGVVTSLNKQAEVILERKARKALGLPINTLVQLHDDDGSFAPLAFSPTEEGRRSSDDMGARRLSGSDGSARSVESASSAIRGRDGTVVGRVIVLRDVSAAQVLADEMRRLAECDALTGLPNRLVFDSRLRSALAVRDPENILAVLYMDLDGFKAVNDTHGHDAGDALLKVMGTRFQAQGDGKSIVCRLGGDEFVVLITGLNSRHGALIAAQGFVDVARTPVQWGEQALSVTLSIGVAVAPADGTDPLSLMRKADQALYRAKHSGRNQVVSGD